MEHSHTSHQQKMPGPSFMNIEHFGCGGALTLETCNGARKTRHIFFKQVNEAVEVL